MSDTLSFATSGGLVLWADYFCGWMDENPSDRKMPYVMKDGLFHYFTQQDDGNYVLQMTSSFDLKQEK